MAPPEEDGEIGEIPRHFAREGAGEKRRRSRSRSRERAKRPAHRDDSRDDHGRYRDDRRRGDSRDARGGGRSDRRDLDRDLDRDRDRDRDRDHDRERDRGARDGGRGRDRSRDRGHGARGGDRRDARGDRRRRDDSRPREERKPSQSGGEPDAPAARAPTAPAEDQMTPEEEEAYRTRVAAAFEAARAEEEGGDEEREARMAEERRKRREEIMAKHRAKTIAAGSSAAEPAGVTAAASKHSATTIASVASATAIPTRAPPPPKPPTPPPASDMFADDDATFDAEAEERAAAEAKRTGAVAGAADMTAGLSDNWDDAEGYYRARMGEVLDGRYRVMEGSGRGVFSTVVKAKDTQASGDDEGAVAGEGAFSEVAIKVIRANETMYKAAQLEITVLKKLMGADPENKRHCVRFLRSFEYRDHVFMVFESMHMNLREVLKKYGRGVGINVHGVRSYATQMLIALRHLQNCGVVHADIKPDNILVNKAHNVIKICDFGSAMFDGDNEITPYLQSRFYRAPEVILGLAYSHPMDLWSIGCCLYELYTGSIAFQGRSNNEMMKLFIEMKGPVPRKLLRKAAFRENHYDQEGVFSLIEDDPVTHRQIRRLIRDAKPTRDLAARLAAHDKNLADAERRKVSQLADLLDKMFNFDPEKRITVSQALTHPFIRDPTAGPPQRG